MAVAYRLRGHHLPSRSQNTKTATAEDLKSLRSRRTQFAICAEGTRLQHRCAYPRMKHRCACQRENNDCASPIKKTAAVPPTRKQQLCLPRGNNSYASHEETTAVPVQVQTQILVAMHNDHVCFTIGLIAHLLVNEATLSSMKAWRRFIRYLLPVST